MKLLTKKLIERFAEVGSQSESENPVVIAKFFNPSGRGTWYATEYMPEEKIFYGYASIFGDHCDEWGTFALEELENYKSRFGLGIERDLYFIERPFKEVVSLEK